MTRALNTYAVKSLNRRNLLWGIAILPGLTLSACAGFLPVPGGGQAAGRIPINCMMAVAVNVFEWDATRKRWSDVSHSLFSMFAQP